MGPRARRAVAALVTLVYLTAYVAAAITLVDYLPKLFWLKFAYFLVVGVGWGVPLLPLFTWAERGTLRRRSAPR